MKANSDLEQQIKDVEQQMQATDFWEDKERAQAVIKEYQELKALAEGKDRFDAGNAVMSILAGAGGTDAEDFARMLAEMYWKYIESRGWSYRLLHENQNDHGGFRNITFDVIGKNVYGTLKNESGVHRLVRISPFNARQQRHTAFAMVEVIPEFPEIGDIVIPEDELDISFARAGGPGGQNVNKRETAVRIVHKPTTLAVHVATERSQAQNKEKALELLRGKLYKRREEEQKAKERGLSVSTDTAIEWGNQIRSYVLHPYKMVKDHRTDVEVRDTESVFDGTIQPFIDAFTEDTSV